MHHIGRQLYHISILMAAKWKTELPNVEGRRQALHWAPSLIFFSHREINNGLIKY